MTERETFLDHIKNHPHDTSVRGIFADWLDDHDEPEEADFFRSWTIEKHKKAEDFFWELVNEINKERDGQGWSFGDEHKTNYHDLTVEMFLEAAQDHLNAETYNSTLFFNFDTPDILHNVQMKKEMWRHFQILTGRRILEKEYDEGFFRCGC